MVFIISSFIFLLFVFLVFASGYIGSGIYVKAICRLRTTEKVLALTFDDGPDEKTTPLVLDILAKHRIKAVFFCIGNKMAVNESIVQRIISEGHSIGNHTYNHQSLFPMLPLSLIRQEIEQCDDIITANTGQKGLSLFRPPFGVTNPPIAKVIREYSYQVLGWSIRSLDTTIRNPQRVIDRVTKKMKPGDIILFHDNRENCPAILDVFIEKAKQAGYKFVRADDFIKKS